MPLASSTAENAAANAETALYISLHSGSPGTGGANELSGGSYARASAGSWTAASGGTISNGSAISISVPAGSSATYFGVWSAATGGTYWIGGALSTTITGPTTATLAVGSITISAS